MNYIETTLELKPFRPYNEIFVAALSEIGYESFVEEEISFQVKAYIQADLFSEKALEEACEPFTEMLEFSTNSVEIEKENWNQKWEESFDPVEVGSFCVIRAPFHTINKEFKHEIIIEPKMSFGTGHHQTTQMMVELMENIEFTNSMVLDMGSGTGILAILAQKMSAKATDAIDIEDWAFENMKENVERNNVQSVNCYLGGVEVLKGLTSTYQTIIANINKNILLSQFETYNAKLATNGNLLLSGFYEPDAEDILNAKDLLNFKEVNRKTKDGWCALHLKKIK